MKLKPLGGSSDVQFRRSRIREVTIKTTTPQCGVDGSGPGCRGGYRSDDVYAMVPQCVTPHCVRSVVKVLVVREDIVVITYETMTHQCGRSVVCFSVCVSI